MNGHWLGVPHGEAGQQWWRDSLMLDVLFSPNHGLLAWQPVLYLSVLGAPLFLMRDRYLGALLTLVFAAQVYINGAVATWWGGSAFGGRRFDGCSMFFVLGLAALITSCRKRPGALVGGIFAVLLTINAFFMLDVFSGRLPLGDGISSSQILDATIRRVGNPFALPASAILAWRSGADLATYDRVGLRLYNSPQIDVGDPSDEGFLAGGWSGREQEHGTTYRWAEGRVASFIIGLRGPTFLQPHEAQRLADYVLRIGAAPFTFAGSPPQGLNLEVNGTPVDGYRMRPEFSEYSFDIPHRLLHRSLNVFTLHFDYARSPQSLRMSDDARTLSVRVDYIKFFPK